MSNQTNPNKVKLQIWMDKSLIAQVDGIAAKKGVSRAAVVTEAVRQYLDAGSRPATSADLAAVAAKIDSLESIQKAAVATIARSIENQPIVIQDASPALPETASAIAAPDPDAWRGKSLLDRILKR